MKPVLAYSAKVYKNFFCISFINTETDQQYECYALSNKRLDASTLIKIINSCLLVGYGNDNFDDLILNYIYHNKYITVEEIYELGKAINEQQVKGIEVWRSKELEFYMRNHVESFDLIETSSIDGIVKFNDRDVEIAELDILFAKNREHVRMEIMALSALKIRFKHGFTTTPLKVATRDMIRENYIKRLLQINN
jgi:hypothetical protein